MQWCMTGSGVLLHSFARNAMQQTVNRQAPCCPILVFAIEKALLLKTACLLLVMSWLTSKNIADWQQTACLRVILTGWPDKWIWNLAISDHTTLLDDMSSSCSENSWPFVTSEGSAKLGFIWPNVRIYPPWKRRDFANWTEMLTQLAAWGIVLIMQQPNASDVMSSPYIASPTHTGFHFPFYLFHTFLDFNGRWLAQPLSSLWLLHLWTEQLNTALPK